MGFRDWGLGFSGGLGFGANKLLIQRVYNGSHSLRAFRGFAAHCTNFVHKNLAFICLLLLVTNVR